MSGLTFTVLWVLGLVGSCMLFCKVPVIITGLLVVGYIVVGIFGWFVFRRG